MKRLLSAAAVAAAFLLAGPGSALAGDTICGSSLGAVTVDNVIVVGECTMVGTTVDGNVKVLEDASLWAEDATIYGNLQSDKADTIDIEDTTIGGDVQLFGTTELTRFVDNDPVGGTMQAFRNKNLTITGNTILGDLECLDNDVLSASNNMVNGGTSPNECLN